MRTTSPRKPLFYGWWIAVAAATGMGLGGPPILVFAFPVFLKAFTEYSSLLSGAGFRLTRGVPTSSGFNVIEALPA